MSVDLRPVYKFKVIRSFENPLLFTSYIYNNFPELKGNKDLKHNKIEIQRLLTSKHNITFLVYNQKNLLIGYLVGEMKQLGDGRYVYYVTYMYVARGFRSKGIGSRLLMILKNYCTAEGILHIMLTYDSSNKNLDLFYRKRGFMPDPIVRTFSRYDVMSIFL